jgi:hypothetical protein
MALTDSLISYWKLDETSGNAIDAHGSNTLTAVASPGTAAGKIETARTFNGSSQYFSVASNASVQVGNEDFYVAGWVYLNSVTAVNRVVVGKYNTNTGAHRQWLLFFRGPTQRFALIGSPNGSTNSLVLNSSVTPSASTWYFVEAWHDAANDVAGIAVNGTVDTIGYASGIYSGPSSLFVGCHSGASDFLDGRIDELGFWKRVLSPTERAELYNSGAGLAYPWLPNATNLRRQSAQTIIRGTF